MVNNSEADWLHVDVMDGVFVPNISFGLPVVEAMKRHSKIPLDVHLMIVEPEKYIESFLKGRCRQNFNSHRGLYAFTCRCGTHKTIGRRSEHRH